MPQLSVLSDKEMTSTSQHNSYTSVNQVRLNKRAESPNYGYFQWEAVSDQYLEVCNLFDGKCSSNPSFRQPYLYGMISYLLPEKFM